jgi:hypothetical protein
MCGDDLTRANIMKAGCKPEDFTPDTLLPGVKINTSATDFAPIEQLRMMRFKGEKWETCSATSSAAKAAINNIPPAGSCPRHRLNIAPRRRRGGLFVAGRG